ncbi:hypothetical protein [Acinetobacter seifertii]|uniref:hypothetical protein n=1 Tax=Acinetobacter seifertii TaxID=1530123 RepID=UPI0027DE2153|nr:hypothetical protein [Acinetobacter seifertii]
MIYNYYFDLDGTLIDSNVEVNSITEVLNVINSKISYIDFKKYCDDLFNYSPFFNYMISIGIGVNELFWIDQYFHGDELEDFYKWVDVFQRECYKYIKELSFCEKNFPCRPILGRLQ